MSYFEFCIIPKFTTPSVTALRLYVSLFKNFTTILSPLRGFQKRVKVRRTDSMVELKITSILLAASRRHIFRIRHLIVLITYVLVWRNDTKSPTHFYAPFPGQVSVPDFMKFYDDPYTLFEKDLKKIYR